MMNSGHYGSAKPSLPPTESNFSTTFAADTRLAEPATASRQLLAAEPTAARLPPVIGWCIVSPEPPPGFQSTDDFAGLARIGQRIQEKPDYQVLGEARELRQVLSEEGLTREADSFGSSPGNDWDAQARKVESYVDKISDPRAAWEALEEKPGPLDEMINRNRPKTTLSSRAEFDRIMRGEAPANTADPRITGSSQADVHSRYTIRPTININTANADSLTYLAGIGPHLAQEIVNTRNERGGHFNCVDDLNEIKGIGDKIIEVLRNSVEL